MFKFLSPAFQRGSCLPIVDAALAQIAKELLLKAAFKVRARTLPLQQMN
jgi:hypothetical protein